MHNLIDFKGFKAASIELLRPFTLLIGPNGSGKTNVIEAIELLSFVAHGHPFYEIADVGRAATGIQIRGGLQGCSRMGKNLFALSFTAGIRLHKAFKPVAYEVYIYTKPHPQILSEQLTYDGRIIYETLIKDPASASRDLVVKYDNFAHGGKKPQTAASSERGPEVPIVNVKPQTAASSERSVLSQYREIAQENQKFKECMRLVHSVMNHLQASFVFDPNPKLMHSYERIGNSVLSRDGANLSAVLYALSIGDEAERESLDRLLSQIRQLPDEPYEKFIFTVTKLGDVIFGLRERTGYPVDARSLSDGTLRTLAILTALETAQKGSRVIVEEFDNGLHPSRVGVLTSAIEEAIKRRDLNVLVTTHNPATMNNLTAEQMEGVVLCTWSKEKEAADLVELMQVPRSDELLERGQLGDLVSRRVLEQYVAPEFEEQRRKKMLAWIEALP